MCVSLVCVLVSFRASVRAFRVSELLVVRLSFVVKLFRLRCVSCEIPRFRVEFRIRIFRFVALFDFSNFDFRVEFRIRIFVSLLYSIFDSSFEFKFLEFFVSNFEFEFFVSNLSSNFEFEFFVSLLYSTSRISNSNSSSKFLVEIFVVLLYSISRISL